MPMRTAFAIVWLMVTLTAAGAQGDGTRPVAPDERPATSGETAAARHDGALMTHANEQKAKAGHSETSAAKSGK